MIHVSDSASNRRNRLILRCVLEFLLDECRSLILSHEGSITRAAVHLAVAQASQRRPAGPAGAISVRAVAQSLDLAYETTRRQVGALEAAGLLARAGESGVRISDDPTWPRVGRARGRLAALRALVADLKGLNFEFDPGPLGPPVEDDALAAPLSDLLDDFILRVLEAGVEPYGSMLDAVIFSALVVANAEAITYDPELAATYAWSDSPPPDALRRPATVTELAERLGMPHETVRRRLARHQALGWADRVRGGYLSAMSRQQAPEVMQGSQIIVQRFLQLIRAARQIGLDVEAIGPKVRRPASRVSVPA